MSIISLRLKTPIIPLSPFKTSLFLESASLLTILYLNPNYVDLTTVQIVLSLPFTVGQVWSSWELSSDRHPEAIEPCIEFCRACVTKLFLIWVEVLLCVLAQAIRVHYTHFLYTSLDIDISEEICVNTICHQIVVNVLSLLECELFQLRTLLFCILHILYCAKFLKLDSTLNYKRFSTF